MFPDRVSRGRPEGRELQRTALIPNPVADPDAAPRFSVEGPAARANKMILPAGHGGMILGTVRLVEPQPLMHMVFLGLGHGAYPAASAARVSPRASRQAFFSRRGALRAGDASTRALDRNTAVGQRRRKGGPAFWLGSDVRFGECGDGSCHVIRILLPLPGAGDHLGVQADLGLRDLLISGKERWVHVSCGKVIFERQEGTTQQ